MVPNGLEDAEEELEHGLQRGLGVTSVSGRKGLSGLIQCCICPDM